MEEISDDVFVVKSQTEEGTDYLINLENLTCTCRQFTTRLIKHGPSDPNRLCKHLASVLLEMRPLNRRNLIGFFEVKTIRVVKEEDGKVLLYGEIGNDKIKVRFPKVRTFSDNFYINDGKGKYNPRTNELTLKIQSGAKNIIIDWIKKEYFNIFNFKS